MNTHTHSTPVPSADAVDTATLGPPTYAERGTYPDIPAFTTPAVEAAHAAYRQSHGVDALKAQRLHRAWVWAKAQAIKDDI